MMIDVHCLRYRNLLIPVRGNVSGPGDIGMFQTDERIVAYRFRAATKGGEGAGEGGDER